VNVLLTGANGFVGSHVLEELLRVGHGVSLLLRRTSDTRFIQACLAQARTVYGSLSDVESLGEAVRGADAVIHCAGKTKAVRRSEYYDVNLGGTRNLVTACNTQAGTVRHFVLISSLAARGVGTVQNPATEGGRMRPVTAYGRSKMLAERHVRRACRTSFTVLRPCAVYGPRDRDFYLLFRTVQSGLAPLIDGGLQPLSLIYVRDLAKAVVRTVGCLEAFGRTYHLAHPAPTTQKALTLAVAQAMGVRAAQVFLPHQVLYPVCMAQDLTARVTGTPSILNLEKIPEYAAPGWVCSTERAAEDLGFVAGTGLDEGVRETLDWYRRQGWLCPA